jgi:hypothetical protein
MKNKIKELISIILEYGEYIVVSDLDIKVQGCILTHLYYNEETDTLHYFSGDIVEDKYAEELFPNEKEFEEIYEEITDAF